MNSTQTYSLKQGIDKANNLLIWKMWVVSSLVLALISGLAPEFFSERYGANSIAGMLKFPNSIESYIGELSILNFLSLWVAGLYFIRSFGTHLRPGQRIRNRQTKIWIPYALVWTVVSLLLSSKHFPGLGPWVSLSIVATFALFGVREGAESFMEKLPITTARFLIIITFVEILISPERAFAPYSVWPGGWFVGQDRLQGPFAHPISLSWVLALAIFLEFMISKGPAKWAFVVLASYLLVLTGSRATSISLLVGLVMLLFLNVARKTNFQLKVVWSTFSIVVLALLLSNLSQMSFGSFNGRTNTWQIAWENFTQSPLFGLGPVNYVDELRYATNVGYAHNQLLETASTLGIIGLVALLSHIIYLFRYFAQKRAELLWATPPSFDVAHHVLNRKFLSICCH